MLSGDVRFATRHFARRPLTATTIVLVLSIGIGVHSAVFSLIQAVTMRPAPGVPRDAALVRIRGKEQLEPGGKWFPRGLSYTEFREIAEHRELFVSVAGMTFNNVALGAADGSDNGAAEVQFVTGDFFTALGIHPVLGTALPPTPSADRAEPEFVAVIGHTMWQDVYGASPDIVGRSIRVNGTPVRVIGVAPPRFNGAVPSNGSRTLWLPLSARAPIMRSTSLSLAARDSGILQSFARLAPGAIASNANATVRVVSQRAVAQMTPAPGRTRETDVVPLRGDTNLPANGDAIMIAAVYGSMALLILIITCTNVSALVVGAAVARRQEIAIRLSLGASRWRVVRQLLTESMLLSVVGGSLGLVLYWWITTLIATRVPGTDLSPDLATVAYTMCFAMGTGILFGISPALNATRRGIAETLKGSGIGATQRSRLQRAFVVAQIVFTQPLLVGIAMFFATLIHDSARQPGNEVASQVIQVRFQLFAGAGSYQAKSAALENMMMRIAGAPGVARIVPDAGSYTNVDLTTSTGNSHDPEAARTVSVHLEVASPGYFSILGIPLIRGRDLVTADTAGPDLPVIIGSDLAHDLWGNADPIGRRFTQAARAGRQTRDAVVIGVFDARYSTSRGAGIRVYGPQDGRLMDSYLIRTTGPAAPLVQSMRALIREEVPNVPIGRMATLAEVAESNRTDALQVSGAAGIGGVLALLLTSIGLYGVVALALGQRRREIGIRMALGARPQQVVRMLFADGVTLSVVGLVLGLPLSIVALKMLAGQAKLPDINMMIIGVAIALVVIGVASFATWLPARRAATVNPAETLRAD